MTQPSAEMVPVPTSPQAQAQTQAPAPAVLTARQLYARILPHALGAFASRTADVASAQQSAQQLAELTVCSCIDLGIVAPAGASAPAVSTHGLPFAPPALPGVPEFARTEMVGPGAVAMSAPGTPGEPARHYNYPPVQNAPPPPPAVAMPYAPFGPQSQQQMVPAPQQMVAAPPMQMAPPAAVGGAQVVPPAGPGYVPPPPGQAGVMSSVIQAPEVQNPSALGTTGVIAQPEQKPNAQATVVAPGNERCIPAVGGQGTTFVPEKIVR